jgi:glycosyltransferase involved in cell wall biosynthesis
LQRKEAPGSYPEVPELTARPGCIVHCSVPYNGRGWSETCAVMVSRFPGHGLTPTVVLPRATRSMAPGVRVVESIFFPASRLPWRLIEPMSDSALDRTYRRELLRADPSTTVVYAWPGISIEHVAAAKERGFLVVRQMINTGQAMAKRLLDSAYAVRGLEPGHGISEQAVASEMAELAMYDHVLAPNALTAESLLEVGIPADRIVPTSFGWSPKRLGLVDGTSRLRDSRPLRFLFVGRAGLRKGVPDLLEAWELAGKPGELFVVGDVEPSVRDLLDNAVGRGSVVHVPFTDNVGSFYATCDVFVMPTHEEGGPQVTLEAGGFGLAVVVTPMGAARLIEHEGNGLVVPAGDAAGLAAALRRLADDPPLRQTLGRRVATDAKAFTYDRVSARHADLLVGLLRARNSA